MHLTRNYIVWVGICISVVLGVIAGLVIWHLENHSTVNFRKTTNSTNRPAPKKPEEKRTTPILSDLTAASTSPTEVTLTWSVSNDDSHQFLIYRGKPSSLFSKASQIGFTRKMSFTDSQVKPNTRYAYWVVPNNGSPTKTPKKLVTVLTRPSPIKGMKQAGPAVHSVTLSWLSAGQGVSYEIYRGSTFSSAKKITTVNSTTYTDTGLSPVSEYTYWIITKNPAGITIPKQGFTVITQPPVPLAENHLVVLSVTPHAVTITWSKMEDATDYALFRFVKNANGTMQSKRIAVVKTLFYTDKKITPQHSYRYVVVPFNNKVPGSFSPTLIAHVIVPDTGSSKGYSQVKPIGQSTLAHSINWENLNP